MAYKACAYVIDQSYDANGLVLDVKIMDEANTAQISYGPVGIDVTSLNDDLRAFVKTYAETNFQTVFEVGDTVKLLNPIG